MNTFEFVTDTATMCIYDLGALKHRLDDTADWWSIRSEEFLEINAGNVAFINLGGDGKFVVDTDSGLDSSGWLKCNLKVPTGKVFVGAGEEVTGDGLEPECIRGGGFLQVNPGIYVLSVGKISGRICMALKRSDGPSGNSISVQLRI
jgi:hypothetical protein